jgi:hypothetical protein
MMMPTMATTMMMTMTVTVTGTTQRTDRGPIRFHIAGAAVLFLSGAE